MDDFNIEKFWQQIKSKFGVEALIKGATVAALVLVTPKIASVVIAFAGVIWAYRKGQGK